MYVHFSSSPINFFFYCCVCARARAGPHVFQVVSVSQLV